MFRKMSINLLVCLTVSLIPTKSFSLDKANANVKIGILDMQKVILNVEEGKKARASLETEIKSKEAYFMKLKQELEKMNKELQEQSALLSQQARQEKQNIFQEKFLKMRNEEMEFQNNIKKKEQEETQKIASKAASFSESLAKKHDLELVLEPHSSGLVYIKHPIDITDEVIKMFSTKK